MSNPPHTSRQSQFEKNPRPAKLRREGRAYASSDHEQSIVVVVGEM
ncbi:hypothetical protein E2C01_045516 [Portunus trituberculatus]|uniref:Uncharacterized protein n=1 Tax=Portunus trituberculatus TaxID=210409 RepID=A0A5B7G593_PORTR|nr:hypothetical protein [Portunus trituberculatus]